MDEFEETRKWLQKCLDSCSYPDLKFNLIVDYGTFFLEISADEICTKTGEKKLWTGRRWHLHDLPNEAAVAQTCFMAIMAWQEHETREKFKWCERAVFGPHHRIETLWSITEL